jgi:hypothetical protein
MGIVAVTLLLKPSTSLVKVVMPGSTGVTTVLKVLNKVMTSALSVNASVPDSNECGSRDEALESNLHDFSLKKSIHFFSGKYAEAIVCSPCSLADVPPPLPLSGQWQKAVFYTLQIGAQAYQSCTGAPIGSGN